MAINRSFGKYTNSKDNLMPVKSYIVSNSYGQAAKSNSRS